MDPIEDIVDNKLETKETLSASLHTTEKLPSLRTYQGDIASFIKSKDKSVTDIAIKNREEKEKREVQEEEGTRKNYFEPIRGAEKVEKKDGSLSFLIYLLGFVLIFASVGVIGFLVWTNFNSAPIINTAGNNSLIRTEYSVVLDVSSFNASVFAGTVLNAKKNPEYIKGTTEIEVSDSAHKTLITSADFIHSLKWNMPAPLVRTLAPEYITGITSSSRNPEFFLILKIKDYGIAFRDMLAWEESMQNDLAPLLNTDFASSSDYTFKDIIVKNKDARVLSSRVGTVALIYTFINQNTLLITESAESMTALVNSFVAGNAIR